ncbi:patatin-like phospholipase RssA [Aliidiomarina haloalkalitolerans]|uniref:Patatin n=1 Tax=Aliidiomarina haloalkalitolerans TaxID=859059 RepID=A0A432VY98_9GAMM|nr:patatin-like phospholipase RssA [Aliidiomarina haloalkalitolerans]MCL4409863.1 patatin-like phospholipase RssA [Gammaproteobacteria bacterium]RUO21568.1 patatin [Aliidiomarina haloalkalitolerans]
MATNNKLKVGLALGSGAARGWAHIGVIRALEDMGIEIQIVTGTSIGSLVGGAYAAGKLDELEKWVRGMDRWAVFNLLDFGLSSGGMVGGEKVFNHARERFGALEISTLERRYAAIATDLYTGKEIWLKKGDLFSVARASCAMPGLLAPKSYDGRWLVDGALVNPVPVSLARALEADFVIAVHLNSQVHVDDHAPAASQAPQSDSDKTAKQAKASSDSKKVDDEQNGFQSFLARSSQFMAEVRQKFTREPKSPSMLGVMAGSIDIMQERITKARMAGDPPDILLQPKLGDIGLLEFDHGSEAIDIGYETTIRLKDLILDELRIMKKRRNGGPTR